MVSITADQTIPADLHRWRVTGRSGDGQHVTIERRPGLIKRLLGRADRSPVRVLSTDAWSDVQAGDGTGDGRQDVGLPDVSQGRRSTPGDVSRSGRARSWEPNNDRLAQRSGVVAFDIAYAVDPVMEAGRLAMCQPVIAADWRAVRSRSDFS